MSLILGIESSCDETAAAVVRDGYEVLSSSVASQIASHAVHGGVVPELAAREHLTALQPVLTEALTAAGITMAELDAVAVTNGPGLMPALLLALNFAKGLAAGHHKPLNGNNQKLGHTSLLLGSADGQARQIGSTIDDAAGEALDKAAKLLRLGYPGGPVMQRTAEGGDGNRFHFPRPLTGTAGKAVPPEHKYNFSFSGVKTALLYHVQKYADADGSLPAGLLQDTAASYQEAVVDVLVRKTLAAARDFKVRTIVVAGGVACNAVLRERFNQSTPNHIQLRLAQRKHCTDNAAMVAGIGHHYFKRRLFSAPGIDAFARLPVITEVVFVDAAGARQ